jgi:hypothetical protein
MNISNREMKKKKNISTAGTAKKSSCRCPAGLPGGEYSPLTVATIAFTPANTL